MIWIIVIPTYLAWTCRKPLDSKPPKSQVLFKLNNNERP